MVYLTALWLPILLSAVAVFIGSSVIHMVLGYHKRDYSEMPEEDAVLAAMRQGAPKPGFYPIPCSTDPKELSNPEMVKKFEEGPVAFVTVMPNGVPNMGKILGIWFVYCLVVAIFIAYLTGRTVPAGADYLLVFRVAGTAAFLAFAGSTATESIWKGQPWSNTARHTLDGLIYALLVGGVFGSLWPSA